MICRDRQEKKVDAQMNNKENDQEQSGKSHDKLFRQG
jgi:hypothetical protein